MEGAYHNRQQGLPIKVSYCHFGIDLDIGWIN
jgi:hypothetical protein